ncbi:MULTISPECIES: hypothetical protein [unclassified Bradyrhizobium]|uniref:hypothetical protein n=1 Tax=unclassified Bradyrhizobium TaxID=2631580 RepID=UPI00291681BB|nr:MULTISPECIES: hypothetical protein [unclassified Bradyrhizobium]
MTGPRSYRSCRSPDDGTRDFISAYACHSKIGAAWNATDDLDPLERIVIRLWWKRIIAAYAIAAFASILPGISWTDRIGLLAAGTVVAAFCMSSLTALRLSAIAGNLLFVAYGVCSQFYTVLLPNTVLVAINLIKLASLHSSAAPRDGPAAQAQHCNIVESPHNPEATPDASGSSDLVRTT